MADSSRVGCENERNPVAVKSLILEIRISCTPWSTNTQCNELYHIALLTVPATDGQTAAVQEMLEALSDHPHPQQL